MKQHPKHTLDFNYITEGKMFDKAIEFVKSKRTSMHLEEVQEKALKDWGINFKKQ